MTWRWWAGFAVAWRGDWAAAAVAAAVVLLPVAWRVRGELLATRDLLLVQPEAGRHRRRGGRPRELRPVAAADGTAAR